MTAPEKTSKFIIRAALKDLQQKRTYKTLDTLREDLENELVREGYELNDEEKSKIRLIVEEEGYTGKFAIDDIILRKIKNKKYWPLVSIAVMVIIFLITTIAGAFIEYFVQRPLNGKQTTPSTPNTVIAAFFQLPTKVDGGILDFKVTIQNQLGSEALTGLVLFASAEDCVKKIDIDSLPPGGEKTVTEMLNIKGVKKSSFAFNAYIIGPRVSFRSEPIMIEKMGIAVIEKKPSSSGLKPIAMDTRDKKAQVAMNDKVTAAPPMVAMSSEQKTAAQSSRLEVAQGAPEEGMEKKREAALNKDKEPVKEARVELKEMGSDQLAEEMIESMKSLSSKDEKYRNNLQVLQLLAQTGNEKAKKYVEEK